MKAEEFIGKTLDDKYQVLEIIGRGGMAVVYKGVELKPEKPREVAIKILINQSPELYDRFLEEAALSKFLKHLAKTDIYDFGEDQTHQVPYLVMQLLKGGTLEERLKAGPLSEKESIYNLFRIAHVLDFAHGQPKTILHRDITPRNILFDEEESAYLSDFGIATVIDAARQMTAGLTDEATSLNMTPVALMNFMGTLKYMPPEIWLNTKQGDIYGLGLIAWQMLTGDKLSSGHPSLEKIKAKFPESQYVNLYNIYKRFNKQDKPEPATQIAQCFINVFSQETPYPYATCKEFVEALWEACNALHASKWALATLIDKYGKIAVLVLFVVGFSSIFLSVAFANSAPTPVGALSINTPTLTVTFTPAPLPTITASPLPLPTTALPSPTVLPSETPTLTPTVRLRVTPKPIKITFSNCSTQEGAVIFDGNNQIYITLHNSGSGSILLLPGTHHILLYMNGEVSFNQDVKVNNTKTIYTVPFKPPESNCGDFKPPAP